MLAGAPTPAIRRWRPLPRCPHAGAPRHPLTLRHGTNLRYRAEQGAIVLATGGNQSNYGHSACGLEALGHNLRGCYPTDSDMNLMEYQPTGEAVDLVPHVLQPIFSIMAENIFELNFVAYKFACKKNCGVPEWLAPANRYLFDLVHQYFTAK